MYIYIYLYIYVYIYVYTYVYTYISQGYMPRRWRPHSSHAGAGTDAAGAGILRSVGRSQVPAAGQRRLSAGAQLGREGRQRWATRAAPPCLRSPLCRSSSAGRLPRAAERRGARRCAQDPRAVAYAEKAGCDAMYRPHDHGVHALSVVAQVRALTYSPEMNNLIVATLVARRPAAVHPQRGGGCLARSACRH